MGVATRLLANKMCEQHDRYDHHMTYFDDKHSRMLIARERSWCIDIDTGVS
jgi:hypothetical protein